MAIAAAAPCDPPRKAKRPASQHARAGQLLKDAKPRTAAPAQAATSAPQHGLKRQRPNMTALRGPMQKHASSHTTVLPEALHGTSAVSQHMQQPDGSHPLIAATVMQPLQAGASGPRATAGQAPAFEDNRIQPGHCDSAAATGSVRPLDQADAGIAGLGMHESRTAPAAS